MSGESSNASVLKLVREKVAARIRREKLGRYKCSDCGWLWSDNIRNFAVKGGQWHADRPVFEPRSIGFHLPAFLSPFVSLSEIYADFLEAKEADTPAKWTHFYNSRLALAWRPVVAETPASRVMACVDRAQAARVVPAGAAYLTAGIDMQRTGFWFSVWA
jgi:phage terminase large subunit GpA-like protein